MTWADLDSEIAEMFDLPSNFELQVKLAGEARLERETLRQELCRRACKVAGCTESKVCGRGEYYCATHKAERHARAKAQNDARKIRQKRRWRAHKRAAGLCQNCGSAPAADETTICNRCRVNNRTAYLRRRETVPTR